MSEFVPYQSYPAATAAEPLLAILRQREIPFETSVETGQPVFDASFAYNAPYAQFVVKLHVGDLDWVRRLEEDANRNLMAEVSPDHYLFKFSDEELIDILVKQDEWNNLDVMLAGQLLRQRGRDVSADTIHLLRQSRVRQQAQPEQSHRAWLFFGYISSLLGGLLGIFMGAHLHWHRKTLATGQRVPAFSASDRVHGFRIFLLGIVMFVFTLLLQVLG